MSANEMVQRCFRHQHPEAYGLPDALEGSIPADCRFGRTDLPPDGEALPEEPMGNPDAYRL